MNKKSIEGSPERAADRGRAEDLGFEMSDLPSLGDPSVVRQLVVEFATAIINARKDYNADKLSGGQSQALIKGAVAKYGDIFMGLDKGFSALPWHSPEQLGERIRKVLAVDGDTSPGHALFLSLGRSIVDILVEHENNRMTDVDAKNHLQAGIDSTIEVLMGYPR